MDYTPLTWVQGGPPAINAGNLNHVETALDTAFSALNTGPSKVDTIAALKGVTVSLLSGGEARYVAGYYAAGDGGGGTFRYNAGSSVTDNGGTVIAPTAGSGRWERVYDGAINAKWFGAKADNTGDDGVFINAALTWASATSGSVGGRVYAPKGNYRITTALVLPSFITLSGDGPEGTVLIWAGSGTLINLNSKNSVRLQDMQLYSTLTTFTFLDLTAAFNCDTRGVRLIGTHSQPSAQLAQTGVVLAGNGGDNHFSVPEFFYLGTAIKTEAIMNFVTDGKFIQCYKAIKSTSGVMGAGISICNSTFASTPADTPVHIEADTGSNSWWITNCWFEGSEKCAVVGVAGVSGPLNFSMVNCTLAATVRNLEINLCSGTTLTNIRFSQYGASPPTLGQIYLDPGWSQGTAQGITSDITGTLPRSSFPIYWTYLGPNDTQLNALTGVGIGTGGAGLYAGAGSPESVVTAPAGSLYLNTSGGLSTTLYVKQSGTGNTGWVKSTSPAPSASQTISAASNTILANAEYAIISNTTGGGITLTSTPTIADGIDGQQLKITNVGTQNVTLQDQGALASSNIRAVTGGIVLTPRDTAELTYLSAVGDWVQTSNVVAVV